MNNKEKEKDNKDKREKRVYLDTLVIALILDNSSANITNMIKLKRKIDDIEFSMDKLNILEINVFKLTNPFFGGPKIFGKPLSKDGMDWIKLISLRSWAVKKKGVFCKYIFPKLMDGYKYSNNKYINDAINELILGNQILLTYYTEVEMMMNEIEEKGKKEGIEEGREEGRKEGEKKAKETKLVCAYLMFIEGVGIEQFNLEYTYDKNEIKRILQKEVKAKLNDEIVEKFIAALEKKNAISK